MRPQGPFSLPNGAEPEPDILVVPGTAEDYADNHPLVTDVILLVEVSDSTLGKDIGPKRVSYAQAGVQDYWVVDLVHRQLEVSRLHWKASMPMSKLTCPAKASRRWGCRRKQWRSRTCCRP